MSDGKNSRARELVVKERVRGRSEASAHLEAAGDCAMIVRGVPRMIVMLCPCNCGEELVINLDSHSGKAWRLYERNGKVTVYPSYWRDDRCQSHFIIWNNRIQWCDFWEDHDYRPEVEPALEEMVKSKLSDEGLTPYWVISEGTDEIPWEILLACRQLASKGLAVEGRDRERGKFRLVKKI